MRSNGTLKNAPENNSESGREVVMRDSRLGKRMKMGLIVSCVSVLGVVPSLASADGNTQMLQFELTFGGKAPVSSFYMSMRPAGVGSALQLDTDTQSMIRIPLFSTDRSRVTMLNPLPILYANGEGSDSSQAGEVEHTAAQKIGKVVLGGVVFAVAIGSMALAGKEISNAFDFDICSEGCVGPIEIPDLSSIDPNSGN
jgi:hypothetical protein